MVSKASDDFPDPLSPVMTVNVFRGISTSMFLRLCCRAPCTVMRLSKPSPVDAQQVDSAPGARSYFPRSEARNPAVRFIRRAGKAQTYLHYRILIRVALTLLQPGDIPTSNHVSAVLRGQAAG